MRKILLSFSLVISGIISATNYYVSTNTGNDNNLGTSPSTPFQTISKINSLMLYPGDSVLFACGNVFRGQVVIKESGSEGKPIVISKYGTGAPPCIKGSEVINGTWTVSSGNIYKTFLEFNPKYVFVNENWHAISMRVNSLGPILTNKEFYYEPGVQTLYLLGTKNSAPNGLIEGSIYDYAIQLSTPGQKYIQITGLNFRQQKIAGIFLPNDNSNIVIYRCDFINLSSAIAANRNNNSSNLQISFNLIQNSFQAGLLLENCNRAKIIGNNIQNCGIDLNATESLTPKDSSFSLGESGIELNGTSCVVMENRIDSAAQSGISISGNHNVIYHNEISNCCLMHYRCAGIYCKSIRATLIKENIIHQIYMDGKNPIDGDDYASPSAIILDSEKNAVQDSLEINGNTIYNCEIGICFKSLFDAAVIRKNIFYNVSGIAFQIVSINQSAEKLIVKMKINDNDFYVLQNNSILINLLNRNKVSSTLNFATCDSNNYYFLTGDGNFHLETSNAKHTYNLTQWKTAGYDQHSTFFTQTDLNKTLQGISADSVKKITATDRFPIYVNNSTQQKNLTLKTKGYKYVNGEPIPETIVLPPCSSIILRNDNPPKGNAKVTNGRG